MNQTLVRRLVSAWFGILVAGSAFFAVLLLIPRSAHDWPPIAWFLHLLLLNDENNVAVWWSGSLLAIAAIHAFDGWGWFRSTRPRVARGWAALAIILLILSADELASLHERAFVLLPFSYWGALVPPALILLGLLVYSMTALRSDETHRAKVLPIMLGFACFGSVVVQEFLENRVPWTPLTRLLRTFAEEGMELVGMLVLVRVGMRNTLGLFSRNRESDGPTFSIVEVARRWILILGLPVVVAVAYLTARLPDQQRGHPSDWLAAVLFLFAALAMARPIVRDGSGIGVLRCTTVVLYLLGSLFSVTVRAHWEVEVAEAVINLRMVAFCVLSVLVGMFWLASRVHRRRLFAVVGVFSLAFAFAISAFAPSLFVLYLLTQALAFLVYHADPDPVHATGG